MRNLTLEDMEYLLLLRRTRAVEMTGLASLRSVILTRTENVNEIYAYT